MVLFVPILVIFLSGLAFYRNGSKSVLAWLIASLSILSLVGLINIDIEYQGYLQVKPAFSFRSLYLKDAAFVGQFSGFLVLLFSLFLPLTRRSESPQRFGIAMISMLLTLGILAGIHVQGCFRLMNSLAPS